MSKSRKILAPATSNTGQNFNPADFSTYSEVNTPQSDFKSGTESSGYNYERDTSVDPNVVTPYDLPNLNDTRTANQGTFSSLGNSFAKFVGKTGLNIVGGTVGTAYGVGSAIANGEWSKIWDNSFADKIEEADNKLDNIFKVYKSSDYEQSNFLQKAFLHPLQFTDDTSDALSFTAGAILTELASQGLASATVVPKALRYLKFLGEGAEAAEATSQLSTLGRAQKIAGQFGTSVRQLATGASYESMVEARQATMTLRNKMYADYAKEHGDEPMPESVKNDIDERLSNAGLFSYFSNLALVGTTNILEFPKIFGSGFKSAKAAEGAIVRNAETGLYDNVGKKAFKDLSLGEKALIIGKNPFHEGVVEEGLQNVIQNTNQQYFDRKNNPDAKFDVTNYLHSFADNIADTYSSKEGWNAIGMGMLIGALGAPGRGILSVAPKGSNIYNKAFDEQPDGTMKRADLWTGGVLGGVEEHNEEYKGIQDIVDNLNQNTDLGKSMKANYDYLVTSKTLQADKDKAIANNDIFEFNNAKDDQIHSYVSSRIKAGLYSEIEDTIDDMRKLKPEEFYTQFRGDEADNQTSEEDKVKFQQDTIKEFATKAENTNQAFKIVENSYKGNDEDLKEELIHSIAASKNLDVREKDMNKQIADLSNGLISNVNLRSDNTISLGNRASALAEILKSDVLDEDQKAGLTEELKSLQSVPNKNITINEHNALEDLRESDPTTYTTNRSQIEDLLQDSRKLRERRQQYLNLYNDLFTENGQKAFQESKNNVIKQQQAQEAEVAKQEAIKAAEQAKKDNVKNTKTKVDNAIKAGASEVGNINPPQTPEGYNSHEFDEFLDDIKVPTVIEDGIKVNDRDDPKVISKLVELGYNKEDRNNLSQNEINYILKNNSTNPEVETGKNGIKINNRNNNPSPDLNENIITPTTDIEQPNRVETSSQVQPEEVSVAIIENHKTNTSNKTNLMRSNQLIKPLGSEVSTEVNDSLEALNLDYQRTIGNNIAYLGIDSVKLGRIKDGVLEHKHFDIFDENGNISINKNVDTKLFSQNYYAPGDRVTLSIPTFEQMQERGLDNYTRADYTTKLDDIGEFPIAIRGIDDKIIGYLPTQTNIQNNVAEEFKDMALADNLAMRQTIFDNPNNTHTTTITSKSPGWLILDLPTNQKNLFDSLGDGTKLASQVELVVGKALSTDGVVNPFINTSNQFSSGEIVNKDNLKSGYIYSIVPSSQKDKFIAYPMKINKIGNTNASTIVEAIRLFSKINTNSELTETEKTSLDNITEYNFKNFKDLSDFINTIMYNSTTGNDNTIFKLYKNSLILSKTGDAYTLDSIVNSQGVRDEIASILQDRYYSIDLNNINSKNKFYNYSLKDNTITEDKYNNYQEYLHKNGVITSNIKGIKIENNDYAFTAQSVIGLSNETNRIVRELPQVQEQAPIEVATEVREASPAPIQQSLKYSNIKIGDKVIQGNKTGTITKKANKGVEITFDNGGKVTINNLDNGMVDLYSINSESVANNLQEAIAKLKGNTTEETPKITKKTLFDPTKSKPKNLGDLDINPEYMIEDNIKSGEDLKRRCL